MDTHSHDDHPRPPAARAQSADSARDAERAAVAAEVADRLRRRGVSIAGDESGDQLADLIEAVEAFERAVERAGGDLMVDEAPAREPDDPRFMLPKRHAREPLDAYIGRINAAAGLLDDE